MVLIAAGFIMAGAAGLWLAYQLSQGVMSANSAAVTAGGVFIPVALLVGAGLYLRIRRDRAAEAPSDVEKQRHLVEVLRERKQMHVHELAAALDMDEPAVRDLVEQLIRLEVFVGRVDWEAGMIYSAHFTEKLATGDNPDSM